MLVFSNRIKVVDSTNSRLIVACGGEKIGTISRTSLIVWASIDVEVDIDDTVDACQEDYCVNAVVIITKYLVTSLVLLVEPTAGLL
jgi:hypothetical protein